MSQKNTNLNTAKSAKKDEFYTQYKDIDAELKHYDGYFKDKIVYCNCDNPTWSEFWRYFHLNFTELGLKKLISTHYDAKEVTYKLEYDGGDDNNIEAGLKTPLLQNGDFRSDECVEILRGCDVVVTNPPFSLFKEFIALLMKYEKKFLVIGNMNAISYKEIFPLIKDNKIWLGYSIHSGDREFRVPDDYPLNAAGYRVDKDGNKYIRVKGVRWFANFGNANKTTNLLCIKQYTKKEFPYFDNTKIISVDKTQNIPCDYYGLMGVPITFLDKYNSNDFEIIGNSSSLAPDIFVNGVLKKKPQRFYINGKRLYDRIVVKRRKKQK